eukprot:9454347-Pyramimonas_sp.AAC.1
MHALEPQLQLASTVRGPLTGPRQNVARGGLRALLWAVWMTTGSIVFISDCESVVSRFYSLAQGV